MVNYPVNHRITHAKRRSSSKEDVMEAFSESWRDGKEFTIKLKEDGSIVITQGIKRIGQYKDAHEFAKDFMPEILR